MTQPQRPLTPPLPPPVQTLPPSAITPQERQTENKTRNIAVAVVLIIFAPMVMAAILKILDLHKLVPFVVISYWLIIFLIVGTIAGVMIKKKWGKK